jgi:hypothetical protein
MAQMDFIWSKLINSNETKREVQTDKKLSRKCFRGKETQTQRKTDRQIGIEIDRVIGDMKQTRFDQSFTNKPLIKQQRLRKT